MSYYQFALCLVLKTASFSYFMMRENLALRE
jgi:hypothetical protein